MKSRGWFGSIAYPSIVWFALFLIAPIALVFLVSFATRGTYGGIEWVMSLKNYPLAVQDVYLGIFSKSVMMAGGTALLCTTLAFFMAWAMATASAKMRMIWMLILMLPFLTNLVIRIYAIKLFVGIDGPLQAVLQTLGIGFDPFYFTANPYLVSYGLITCYLPFAVFPLYSAFEKFDFSLVEAAHDLGARTRTVITRILLPSLKAPLIGSFSLVFIPCLGEYVIPDLLGGAKQMLLGNLIVEHFLKARNWPLGSAISVGVFLILLVFFVFVTWLKGSAHERAK